MALEPGKLREMGREELEREETDLRRRIWDLKVQQSTGQLQDPHKLGRMKRELARVLTIMREHELARPAAGARRGGR